MFQPVSFEIVYLSDGIALSQRPLSVQEYLPVMLGTICTLGASIIISAWILVGIVYLAVYIRRNLWKRARLEEDYIYNTWKPLIRPPESKERYCVQETTFYNFGILLCCFYYFDSTSPHLDYSQNLLAREYFANILLFSHKFFLSDSFPRWFLFRVLEIFFIKNVFL